MKLFVGIDVSSKKLDACLMNQEGDVWHSCTVENNIIGARFLQNQILQQVEKNAVKKIEIGMESTSVYSWHPAMYFHQDPKLQEYNTKVYTINPKLIHNFRKAYADMDKTDLQDAWIIADRLRFGRLKVSTVLNEQFMALQRLTRMRFHLMQNLTREKQLFLQNLFYKCSSFTEEAETSAHGQAVMDLLLESYSLDDISEMDLKELADYLREHSKNGFSDPECIAKSIQKAARASYRLSRSVEESIDLLLATSIHSIRSIKKQIDELNKAISMQVDRIPNTLQTIPGIGPVYAAGILAEVGQVERFPNDAAIASYAGLKWKRHQSGNFEAEDTSLAQSGNKYLRYYLVEAANSVKRYAPEYRDYYHKKFKEVPKHQHKRALVLTGRKLVRLIDALLRKGQIYTPGKVAK